MYECHTAQLQHYATELLQKTGGNEDSREAGHTVIDKSSGDFCNDATKYATMAENLAPLNVSLLHAVVRDAVLDTDNVLSATAHVDEPPLPDGTKILWHRRRPRQTKRNRHQPWILHPDQKHLRAWHTIMTT